MTDLTRFEQILGERLGLDVAALGQSACSRALENRLRATGSPSLDHYRLLLEREAGELQELAAQLAVGETWFFRGGLPLYQRLAELIGELATARQPVRILSIPCSTGEEPYSLAIVLDEAGLATDSYRIDAIDSTRSHLERARAALYTSFAFREPNTSHYSRYFEHEAKGWRLAPAIRERTQFHLGNLLDPVVSSRDWQYDFILCRNLFIYLTAAGRERAALALDRLLATDGYLCVTAAEADRLTKISYQLEGPIEWGLYRRGKSKIPRADPVMMASANSSVPEKKEQPTVRNKPDSVRQLLPTRGPTATEQARLWADQGQLAEAQASCENLIREQIELPEAYTLLGVIHQAEGRDQEAEAAFRKALYLAPDHRDALTHMMVLCQTRGDSTRLEAYRQRLRRLAAEDSP